MFMDHSRFLNHLRDGQGCTSDTLKSYGSDLKKLAAYMNDQGIDDILQVTFKVATEYVVFMRTQPNPRSGKQGLSDATVARRLASATSYFDYERDCRDSDLGNPFQRVSSKFKWKKKEEAKPVDDYVLDLLLASIEDKRDQVLFRVMVASGLRVHEVAKLNRDTITCETTLNRQGKEIEFGLGTVIGKGGKKRRFIVDLDTALLCAEYLEGRQDSNPALFISQRKQRISVRTIQERLQHWCAQFEFSHINVHRLRDTFATRMRAAGMDSMTILELLGHSQLRTTKKYVKLSDETLARDYHAAMGAMDTR